MTRFEQMSTDKRYGIYYAEERYSQSLVQWYETEEQLHEAVKKLQQTGMLTVTDDKGQEKTVSVQAYSRIGGEGVYWRQTRVKAVAQ